MFSFLLPWLPLCWCFSTPEKKCIWSLLRLHSKHSLATQPNFLLSQPVATNTRAHGNHKHVCVHVFMGGWAVCVCVCVRQCNANFLKHNPHPHPCTRNWINKLSAQSPRKEIGSRFKPVLPGFHSLIMKEGCINWISCLRLQCVIPLYYFQFSCFMGRTGFSMFMRARDLGISDSWVLTSRVQFP